MTGSVQTPPENKKVRTWITVHRLLVFLILTVLISWIGWTLSDKIDLGLANGFGVIGSAGPALAAIIVSVFQKPEPSGIPGGKRWRLFGIISFLAMVVMVARRLWVTPEWLLVANTEFKSATYPSLLAVLVDAIAALVVGLILSGVFSSRVGVCELLHSLGQPIKTVKWYWWLIAVGLCPFVFLLSKIISSVFGMTPPLAIGASSWSVIVLDMLLAFLYLLIGGGGLEEPGWRGYALTSLQRRFGPISSSLILTVIWGLWHIPFFVWIGGGVQGGFLGIGLNLLIYLVTDIFPTVIIFTAIYNCTGGSLPIVMILHGCINTTFNMIQPIPILFTYIWFLLGLIVLLWMWRSPQTFLRHQENENSQVVRLN